MRRVSWLVVGVASGRVVASAVRCGGRGRTCGGSEAACRTRRRGHAQGRDDAGRSLHPESRQKRRVTWWCCLPWKGLPR